MDIVELSSRVVSDVAGGALSAYGIPGGGVITQALLSSLLAIQDEQQIAISRIDANVQRLIDGPWKEARVHIRDAGIPGRTPEQVNASLTRASKDLYSAIGLQPDDSFARAYVCIDLAVVLRLVGDDQLAAERARDALEAAGRYVEGVRSKENRPPGYKQKAARVFAGNTYLTLATYGIARIVRPKPSGVVKLDAMCNQWLEDVYNQHDRIEAAVAQLVPANGPEMRALQTAAPRGLSFEWGRLRESGASTRGLRKRKRG
jgi:hypothetical protein